MPIENVKVYREVELWIDGDGPLQLDYLTEMPGQNLAVRFTSSFNTESTTPGERPVNIRMEGNIKGRLASMRLTGGTARVYAARVCFRYLGDNSPWQWAGLAIQQTPLEYQDLSLAIPGVSGKREWVTLPVDQV